MKTMQAKKSKTKVVKVGTKQTKAKLPQYKSRHKFVQGKKKQFLKSLTMNPSFMETSSSNTDVVQSSSKIRKKKIHSTVKGSSSKIQHSVDLSLELRDNSIGAQVTKNRDDKKCRNVSQQQRNIGSPIIVEALSENFSSLRIPEILRHSPKVKTEVGTSGQKQLRKRDVSSTKDETCIIIGESVNPNDTSDTQKNGTKIASSLRCNRKQRKEKKSLQCTETTVLTSAWDADEQAPTFEECLENIKLDTTNQNSSVLETEPTTSHRKSMHNVQDVQSPVRFYSLRNKVLVIMSAKTQFCFTGKLIMKVLYGTVEVYGYVITVDSKSIEIYSPRGYSSVSIKMSNKSLSNNETDIWASLEADGICRDMMNKLIADIDQIQPGMGIILLSNLENKLTKFLNVFYPFRLFPKIRNVSYVSWTDPKRAETILQSKLYVNNYTCKELIIDQQVTHDVSQKMLNCWCKNEWTCTLIAGGKSVGKSTSTRCLINSLLPVSKMVVLVDVDPGQTECTPPGCISFTVIEQPLMGPNFTHLKTPAFQLYIGDVNVTRCITRYIEGIKILVDKLCSNPILSHLPIVVNTMGFTQGIGWDIAVFTIKLIRPSLVVQIMSQKSKNNYAQYLNKEVVNQQELPWASWSMSIVDWNRPCDHELCIVNSHAERKSAPVNETWNMEPYQQRELVTTSYFSEVVANPANSKSCYDSISFNINEIVPYVLSFSSLIISIPRVSVPPSHVLNVMNGNIVALCGIDVEQVESEETEITSGLRVVNRLPLCPCYGFGIVRGIDTERGEIFINTPLPLYMIQYVNCLVGCIPVPTTLLQLNQHKNVPYTGGNGDLPMSREPRRGYFRMRYQQKPNNN
ncbi:polynucleotide 5'-hydroxyl-kinase NOL9 [Calliopsis andreniformis]|uniref:polynucleotide 5'-hydroxyl-kinase NOL9 n=1 Tax=Calliopsis andreniformis TaxID=337506 RepID=UPI003FCCA227